MTLALLPNCCILRHRGLHIGFRLLFTTSVLHIGTEPPPSTILDILKKGSYYKKDKKLRSNIDDKH
jgi:hypothetical protein